MFSWSFIIIQVAEGVTTAGAVISLAQKYNVKMPVLTAVARIIDNELTPQAAVLELMSLPQVIHQFFNIIIFFLCTLTLLTYFSIRSCCFRVF